MAHQQANIISRVKWNGGSRHYKTLANNRAVNTPLAF